MESSSRPRPYLVTVRRVPGGHVEHFPVRGGWDEVERLVQAIAWRYWQASFAEIDGADVDVQAFRLRHPDLFAERVTDGPQPR